MLVCDAKVMEDIRKKRESYSGANPYRILYFNPSLGAVKFARMAERYHNAKDIEMMEKIAQLTGWQLMQSSDLNWRQRMKYADNKFQIGYYVYYLIPAKEREGLKGDRAIKSGGLAEY